MSSYLLLTALVLGLHGGAPSSTEHRGPRADTTIALGDRPSVVAFFSVSSTVFAEQPGLRVVLADFQSFLADARPELRSLMVGVHEAYGRPITLRSPEGDHELPIGSGLPVGYYLWSPEGPAYVCRGVRVGFVLVDLVREYLGGAGEAGAALSRCERVE